MILADKLINLRKKEGMTQEDLANLIGVSRQSISKWESQMAMPDLDKIVKLSKIFGVSTDFLLDENLGMEQIVIEETAEDLTKIIDLPSLNDYLDSFKKIASSMTLAVPLVILSPIPVLLLEDINESVGIFIFLALIALAVGLFINAGFIGHKYEFIEKEPYNFSYGVEGIIEKNIEEYRPIFKRNVIIAIAIFILSPAIYMLFDMDTENSTMAIVLFLIMTAVAVALISYTAIKFTSYTEILKYRNPKVQKNANSLGRASSILWILTVGIYLAYSFFTGNWHNSWIIFVIAGFIQVALAVFFDR